jgi:hypothetical protein
MQDIDALSHKNGVAVGTSPQFKIPEACLGRGEKLPIAAGAFGYGYKGDLGESTCEVRAIRANRSANTANPRSVTVRYVQIYGAKAINDGIGHRNAYVPTEPVSVGAALKLVLPLQRAIVVVLYDLGSGAGISSKVRVDRSRDADAQQKHDKERPRDVRRNAKAHRLLLCGGIEQNERTILGRSSVVVVS